MVRCFLALGSNLGDRESHLREALVELGLRGVRAVRSASIYSTEPRGFLDQPWFLNTAIEAETALGPGELLRVCLAVEQSRNRRRSKPFGPRTLDVDIILFGDLIVRSPDLTIPHPRYTARRFVLEPLHEIAFDVVDPSTGRTVEATLEAVEDESSVTLVGPPLL